MPGTDRNLDHLKAPEWVTVEEASDLTGIPKPTLYEWCRDGRVKTLPRQQREPIRIPATEIKRLNGIEDASERSVS